MTDYRPEVRTAIARIAPDVDPSEIADDTPFRDDAGLDSMDFLNVLAEIAKQTGVEVPERDYPQVSTIGALAEYVERHATSAGDHC